MDDSILISIKKALGISNEYDGFDTQIIMAINSAIMYLGQLGVGPTTGLTVTGIIETWADLFNDVTNIEAVKSYIYLKVRLEFDPPITAHLVKAVTDQIDELANRIIFQTEPDIVE